MSCVDIWLPEHCKHEGWGPTACTEKHPSLDAYQKNCQRTCKLCTPGPGDDKIDRAGGLWCSQAIDGIDGAPGWGRDAVCKDWGVDPLVGTGGNGSFGRYWCEKTC